jgi:hypothetical protein
MNIHTRFRSPTHLYAVVPFPRRTIPSAASPASSSYSPSSPLTLAHLHTLPASPPASAARADSDARRERTATRGTRARASQARSRRARTRPHRRAPHADQRKWGRNRTTARVRAPTTRARPSEFSYSLLPSVHAIIGRLVFEGVNVPEMALRLEQAQMRLHIRRNLLAGPCPPDELL